MQTVWTCIETDNSDNDNRLLRDSVHESEEAARAFACTVALEHMREAEGTYPEEDVREICRLIIEGERLEAIGQIESVTSLRYDIEERTVTPFEASDRVAAAELLASLGDDTSDCYARSDEGVDPDGTTKGL